MSVTTFYFHSNGSVHILSTNITPPSFPSNMHNIGWVQGQQVALCGRFLVIDGLVHTYSPKRSGLVITPTNTRVTTLNQRNCLSRAWRLGEEGMLFYNEEFLHTEPLDLDTADLIHAVRKPVFLYRAIGILNPTINGRICELSCWLESMQYESQGPPYVSETVDLAYYKYDDYTDCPCYAMALSSEGPIEWGMLLRSVAQDEGKPDEHYYKLYATQDRFGGLECYLGLSPGERVVSLARMYKRYVLLATTHGRVKIVDIMWPKEWRLAYSHPYTLPPVEVKEYKTVVLYRWEDRTVAVYKCRQCPRHSDLYELNGRTQCITAGNTIDRTVDIHVKKKNLTLQYGVFMINRNSKCSSDHLHTHSIELGDSNITSVGGETIQIKPSTAIKCAR